MRRKKMGFPYEGGGKKRGNWGEYSVLSYMYLKISTPPKSMVFHGYARTGMRLARAGTIAVGSWTPGVGPPESSESCAAALKTAGKWIFSTNPHYFLQLSSISKNLVANN